MGMARAVVRTTKGEERWHGVAEGWLAMPIAPVAVVTDGAVAITVNQILGGVALYTGFTGGNTITTPIAADIIAALPQMDVGDTYVFYLTNTAAQVGTITAGDGDVTLAGFTTVNAQTRKCIIEKTSGTTVTITSI